MTIDAEMIDMPTQRVAVDFEMDAGACRRRIGLIALTTDEATERDFHNMLPDPDEIMFYTSRVAPKNPVTVENLRAMGPQLANAAAQLLPHVSLDTIAFSCTSGTVAIGYEEVTKQIHAGCPDVAVVTPITAALAGFETLGISKISLMTPYVDSVNQAMRHYLENNGINVLNIGSFCMDSDADMARLPPSAIYDAALEVLHPDADALFISCTAIRAVETIDALEKELGKPVLSAIQCLFWQSLRVSGYTNPVNGFGQLMQS